VIEFSASGFRDFTRIAAFDPVMWRDIFLQQPRSGVRDPAALQRRPDRAAARDPLGRGRQIAEALHPHPGNPPLDHRGKAGQIRRAGRANRNAAGGCSWQ
jgi:hypothetical protein